MLMTPLALIQTTPATAVDETQVSNYVPWFSGTKVPMINGPKCLEVREGGSSGCKPDDYRNFIDALRYWRDVRRTYAGYDGARYDLPALKWSQSSFIQPQAMVEDRYLYDPGARKYTVARYLADVERRYGGIDSVLLWPVYPNLGIDARNQLDMIAAMPGGVEGVRQMIADFHRHGVRVLFPMMMWDQGTRDPGKPWSQAIAERMAEIGADGVNGDTQDGVPLAFTRAADLTGHPSGAFGMALHPVMPRLLDVWPRSSGRWRRFSSARTGNRSIRPGHSACSPAAGHSRIERYGRS
jgi:gamma-glutamyl hercynylcysteine S-oxide synthase